MNKFMNFVKDGESKQLPPGFRFQPTDEEIVFQYLARKTFSHPLPASIIPEIDVFSFVPWELPGNSDQDRYFFCNGENKMMNSHSRNLNRSSARETCGGYWKSTDLSYKQIVSSKRRIPIVGIKKTLVFYKGKHPRASKTDWFVNVYFIALLTNNVNNASSASNYMQKYKRNHDQGSLVRIGNWMLCHVFSKKMTKSSPRVCDSVRVRNYDPKIESDLSDGAYYSSSSSVSSLSSCCSSSACSDLSEVSSDSVK